MNYYALQVRTRAEDKYMNLFRSTNPWAELSLYFPKRRLKIRRAGDTIDSVTPIFPGYVFVGSEEPLPYTVYSALKRTAGFFRFLKSDTGLRPMEGRDLSVVLHFVRTGPVAESSKVYFDDNDRIVVEEGPLKGLEGHIVKVDKRKGRAKVKLDLYEDSFFIDLAFETMRRG